MKMKKNYIFMGMILLILIIFVWMRRGTFSKNRQIVQVKGIDTKIAVEDFHITNQSVLLWGQNNLLIGNKEGDIQKKIEGSDEELKVFFANNYAFLYDEDLAKVYQYSELGELLNTIKVPAKVFNISYENGNLVFHIKGEHREHLYLMGSDGVLSEIYSSENKILCHDILDAKNFVIAELELSATGYQTILNRMVKDEQERTKYNHEVALYVKGIKKSVMLTNEHLYRILDKDKFYSREVPNVSDILVSDRRIYLLHSGILSEYNGKLEEIEKKIIAANVNKMERVSSSIYVYGPSDIGGEIGKPGEFYTRLGYSIEKIEINGLTIGALKDQELNLYRVTNRRGQEEMREDLSPSYKEG